MEAGSHFEGHLHEVFHSRGENSLFRENRGGKMPEVILRKTSRFRFNAGKSEKFRYQVSRLH